MEDEPGLLSDTDQGGNVGKGTIKYSIVFTTLLALVVTPYNEGNGEGSQIVHRPTNTSFYWGGDAETIASGYIAIGK